MFSLLSLQKPSANRANACQSSSAVQTGPIHRGMQCRSLETLEKPPRKCHFAPKDTPASDVHLFWEIMQPPPGVAVYESLDRDVKM